MSVDIGLPFSFPPLKRPRETTSSISDDVSKCGEIFVTNNAVEWAFLCSYCEQITNDIGAFICHIRLEHLNFQIDSTQQQQIQHNQQNPEAKSNVSKTIVSSKHADTNLIGFMPTIQIAGALSTEEKRLQSEKVEEANSNVSTTIAPSSQEDTNLVGLIPTIEIAGTLSTGENQPQSEVVKGEETIASTQEQFKTICFKVSKIFDTTSLTHPESDDKENSNTDKNFTATPCHISVENNENFFTVKPIHSEAQTQELSSKTNREIVQDVYVKNEASNNTKYNDDNTEIIEKEQDDDGDSKTSCYFPSEDDVDSDDTDFEIEASVSTMPEKDGSSTDCDQRGYKCPYCSKRIRSSSAKRKHMVSNHKNELMLKCPKCNKGYQTKKGLKMHLNFHDANGFLPCPVCGTKYAEIHFTTHVLTHESETCFPCQVCGKLYANNEKRIKHWKTHAEEKPFHCRFCYRRFTYYRNLARHLLIHTKYRCSVCSAEFNTTETQTPPYVCMACEKPGTDSNENYIATPHNTSVENNENVFTITPIHSEAQTQELSLKTDSKDLVQVVYVKNEAADKVEYDVNTEIIEKEQDGDNDDSKISCYFPSENNVDSNDNKASDNIKPEKKGMKKIPVSSADSELTEYDCPYCSKQYTNKNARRNHILYDHQDILAIKCKKCNRGFNSEHGLILHLKSHHVKMTCPVCATKYSEARFIIHVLTHESDTCFPCQVCGKPYASNEERIKHWKTHAEDKPFHCKICYRRFANLKMLKGHLRSHGQYRCSVCAVQFNTTEKQQPPYICMSCGKLETDSNKEAITKQRYGTDGAANKKIVNQDDSDLEFINESSDDNIASGSSSAKTCETLQTKAIPKADIKF